MGEVLNGGLWGIAIIIILSFIMTFPICDSIRQKNPDVSCKVYNNMDIFTRLYTNVYSIPLILLGFISGALIGRTMKIIKRKSDFVNEKLMEKIGKKNNPWPWEKN